MISNNYTPLRQQGNGVTVAFSALWNMIASGYARVYFEDTTTGVQTPQLSGWSIVLAAGGAGWTVTFVTPPPSTVYVVIGRTVGLDQTNPYRTSRGWQGETVEGSFDKLTAITQDLAEQIERAIVFPLGDSASPVLPPAAQRANTTFIFDSLGNASAGSVTGTTVSAPMIPVVNAASLAIARGLLGALSDAAGAVLNANLATMAANTVKANATAGVASPTDIALALNQLLGRGASGNIAPVTLGAGMSFVGNALTATAGGVTVNVQVFTGSGTYTPTAGMDYCIVECVGGGGGGGGSEQSGVGAGAGGGGGYARECISAATIGASQAVTIGAGGAGHSGSGAGFGTGGGTTSVGALISASGGAGGQSSPTGTTVGQLGGLGGTGSGGNINGSGQPGGSGNNVINTTPNGNGGGSIFGAGGVGHKANAAGNAGVFGGGGSGGYYTGGGAKAGGAGGDGLVVITEFI